MTENHPHSSVVDSAPSKPLDMVEKAQEEWRPIVGWPYEVSNVGRVRRTVCYRRSTKDGLIKPVVVLGYAKINLCRPGEMKLRPIHQLVAEAFIGPKPAPHMLVAHWDGNPLNNQVANLRWATVKENAADSARHGTLARGERVGTALLTDAKAREILTSSETGRALAKRFGVSDTAVSRVRRRRTFRHITP